MVMKASPRVAYMHNPSFVLGLKTHVFYCMWNNDATPSVFQLTLALFHCTCDDYCVPIYQGVIEPSPNPTIHAQSKTQYASLYARKYESPHMSWIRPPWKLRAYRCR